MAFYEDLARCGYYRQAEVYAGLDLIAIGWLEAPLPYWQGSVPPAFVERLFELLKDAWDPHRFRGIHTCTLCRHKIYEYEYEPGRVVNIGAVNLLVPKLDGTGLYVAPSLILHYVIDHQYRPPLEFQAAVMACPNMTSSAYFRRLDRIIPREHMWRDAIFGYWHCLGAALASEAGSMSFAEWLAYSKAFDHDQSGFSTEVPEWFVTQFIKPLTVLAARLEDQGQLDDVHAVRAWQELVERLGQRVPADKSSLAPPN